MKQKIALIGTGISGLSAAYLLHPHHEITVYEKNAYIGGHSRTITLKTPEETSVDTGFIVFNHQSYPHLTALFKRLNVATEKSDMSFGAQINHDFLYYSSKSMFAQTRNLWRPAYWRMLSDILRFNRSAAQFNMQDTTVTLGDYLESLRMSDWFKRYYLQAMGAAIWSCSVETILKFPAATFITFFKNHGLLSVNNHPQWYTVTGGSKSYVAKLTEGFKERIRLNSGVSRVQRVSNGIEVTTTNNQTELYDRVVFACHADEALAMIADPLPNEKEILGAFTYQNNHVITHSDLNFMPRKRNAWASWIYLSHEQKDENPSVSLSYWMNNLQNLKTPLPILVTLNPSHMPDESSIHDRHVFKHPVFTAEAIAAQQKIKQIQNTNGFLFCGAYQRYGFHEDGILSAVNAVKYLGIDVPW